MKLALPALLTLAATPALAHADGTVHAHGSDALLWGLVLIGTAAAAALLKRRALAIKR